MLEMLAIKTGTADLFVPDKHATLSVIGVAVLLLRG